MLNAFLDIDLVRTVVPYDWLGDSETAMLSIIIMSIWQGVGFQMIILLAGLQGIPAEPVRGGGIDKANAWAAVRDVTLPEPAQHPDLRRRW